MTRMFKPSQPGLTLRDDVLPALGLTVTQVAVQLDVSRVAFSRVFNALAAISPDMALRIDLAATAGMSPMVKVTKLKAPVRIRTLSRKLVAA